MLQTPFTCLTRSGEGKKSKSLARAKRVEAKQKDIKIDSHRNSAHKRQPRRIDGGRGECLCLVQARHTEAVAGRPTNDVDIKSTLLSTAYAPILARVQAHVFVLPVRNRFVGFLVWHPPKLTRAFVPQYLGGFSPKLLAPLSTRFF